LLAIVPPSTSTIFPVIHDTAGDVRNSAAAATSPEMSATSPEMSATSPGQASDRPCERDAEKAGGEGTSPWASLRAPTARAELRERLPAQLRAALTGGAERLHREIRVAGLLRGYELSVLWNAAHGAAMLIGREIVVSAAARKHRDQLVLRIEDA